MPTLDRVAEEISATGGVAETAQVDAFDEEAVDEHADAVAAEAGPIDMSDPDELVTLLAEAASEQKE